MGGRGVRAAAALLMLVAVLVGCGETSSTVDGPDQDPAWSERPLEGVPDPDAAVEMVQHDGATIVLSSSEDGDLLTWRAEGRGGFQRPTSATAQDDVRLTVAAAGTERLVAVASAEGDGSSLVPVVFTSVDGAGWAPAPRAFSEPAEVADVVAVGDGFVAVGGLRDPDDPAGGGLTPAIWRSDDGLSWTAADLPAAGDGHVAAVAAVGGLLVAVGGSEGETVVWRSGDDGSIWSQTGVDLNPSTRRSLTSLSAADDTLVAAGSAAAGDGEEQALLLRSADQGATWDEVDLADGAAGVGSAALVGGRGDGFWAVGGDDATEAVLLESGDGAQWGRIDLTGVHQGDFFTVGGVEVSDEGDTLLLTEDEAGLAVWTWPHGQGEPPGATGS